MTSLAVALLVACAGCNQAMQQTPRYDPLEPSDFFANGSSARMPVADTVAQGDLPFDPAFATGKVDGADVTELPVPLTQATLDRGQERFNIYCSPCHGFDGAGNGMIVQRGFTPPPSFHDDRLRQAPVGHFFDVMTNGLGPMPSYASQIPTADRWAIVAYVRALQLSQHASVDSLSESERQQLEGTSR